jgi:hypothetical protein
MKIKHADHHKASPTRKITQVNERTISIPKEFLAQGNCPQEPLYPA